MKSCHLAQTSVATLSRRGPSCRRSSSRSSLAWRSAWLSSQVSSCFATLSFEWEIDRRLPRSTTIYGAAPKSGSSISPTSRASFAGSYRRCSRPCAKPPPAGSGRVLRSRSVKNPCAAELIISEPAAVAAKPSPSKPKTESRLAEPRNRKRTTWRLAECVRQSRRTKGCSFYKPHR